MSKTEKTKKVNGKSKMAKVIKFGRPIGEIAVPYMEGAKLRKLQKTGTLYLPSVASNIDRYIKYVTRSVAIEHATEMGKIIAMGGSDLSILSASDSYHKSLQRLKGVGYQYIVGEGIKFGLKGVHGIEFIPEAPIGHYRYDLCIVPTSDKEDWRIDIESSMSARTPKFESELFRHGGGPFYLVTKGYDLTRRTVGIMLDEGCQPVATVGSSVKGVISYDQMIQDIKDIIRDERTTPPRAAIA